MEQETYGGYLRLSELLDLQSPVSDEPDEVLFIIIHQVYELWFKEILHEIDTLAGHLDGDDVYAALGRLQRVLTVLKTMVAQVDVLETMTPLSYESFRYRLKASSGFQSRQFRELELVLGKRDPSVLEAFTESHDREILERRYASPTMYDVLIRYLSRHYDVVPASAIREDYAEARPASEELQDALVTLYRTEPLAMGLCERFVDLDEGLQEWRYRHVKMVERTIGRKVGTGGSSGVSYLQSTLFQPLFPDLWAIRQQF